MHHKYQPINHDFNAPNNSERNHPEGFNPEDYKQDLDVDELSSQEIEMLQAIWNILISFVDLGWNVDSVQMILPELFDPDSPDSVNPTNDNHKEVKHHD